MEMLCNTTLQQWVYKSGTLERATLWIDVWNFTWQVVVSFNHLNVPLFPIIPCANSHSFGLPRHDSKVASPYSLRFYECWSSILMISLANTVSPGFNLRWLSQPLTSSRWTRVPLSSQLLAARHGETSNPYRNNKSFHSIRSWIIEWYGVHEQSPTDIDIFRRYWYPRVGR